MEATSTARIEGQSSELKKEREKARVVWRLNCEQIAQYDRDLNEKEREIVRLRALLAEGARGVGWGGPTSLNTVLHAEGTSGSSREGTSPGRTEILPRTTRGSVITEVATGIAVTDSTPFVATRMPHAVRRGKAPSVDPFTGEGSELRLDDWLPNLERAATWNGWTDEECLMQFTRHVRGHALMEWNLLSEDEKEYSAATSALRRRFDPGGRALAAQDFRHTLQRENEMVGDFIRRLERTFQLAYGRDRMLMETYNTLIHSQLQEGLRDAILQTLPCLRPRLMRKSDKQT